MRRKSLSNAHPQHENCDSRVKQNEANCGSMNKKGISAVFSSHFQAFQPACFKSPYCRFLPQPPIIWTTKELHLQADDEDKDCDEMHFI